MSEVRDPLAWIKRAEEDFELARSALQRKKPFTASACFHAQQCAEKYMKALLISKGADFPKTHDLLMLNNLCSSVGMFLEINPKYLNTLADYAVRTRYPGDEPELNEAKEAIGHAKLVRNLARGLWDYSYLTQKTKLRELSEFFVFILFLPRDFILDQLHHITGAALHTPPVDLAVIIPHTAVRVFNPKIQVS